jgi:hypothetical protein
MAENDPAGGLAAYRQFIEQQASDFPTQYRQAQENIQQSLEQGRAANSALMEFLNSQRGTGPSPLLQLASGLLRPTRAGGFGESLAAGAEGYAGALQQQRQSELDRAMRIQQLQAATANLGLQATQQRMALTGQALQFPTQLAAAQGAMADLPLLRGEPAQGGVPQTRTQLTVPGAAQPPMPSASPVGPQPQVTATPLAPPAAAAPVVAAPAAPAAAAPAAMPEDVGNLSPEEFNQRFNEYANSLPAPPAREPSTGPATVAGEGSVEETIRGLRAQQAATAARQAAEQAPAGAPPASPAPAAAPAPPAPAPPAAQPPAAEPATRGVMSSDPTVAAAQRLLAEAAANPSRYAGPQGRQLVERARTIVRESPEGRAEVKRAEEQAQEDVRQANAANAADRRFMEGTAEQQSRTFQELVNGAGESNQVLGRLQQLETVMRDLPSGIPGWFAQQAARLNLGPQATQYQVAAALLEQLIPGQRQGMPGAVSDRDVDMFRRSLPRLMSSPDGRRMVTETLKSVSEYQIARGDVAMMAQNGDITRQQALRQLRQLPNPFARFNEYQDRFAAEQAQQRGGAGSPARGAPQSNIPPPPPGIDPREWGAMRPEDRALWQN